MSRRLRRREVLCISSDDDLRRFVFSGRGYDGGLRIEMRFLRFQIARGRFWNCITDLRRIELHSLVQIGGDNGEKQSAIVRTELLGIGLEGAITFRATFHLSFLD
jgi:6-phosphofructokinase